MGDGVEGEGGRQGEEGEGEGVCERDLPVRLRVGMADWGICVVGGIKVQRLSSSRL